jgi:hypothetical protein
MRRLASEMREAYVGRVAAVGALQAATGRELADIRDRQHALATARREELRQFAALLQRDVANRQHDLRVERAAATADQRRRLESYRQELRQNLGSVLSAQAAARDAERERQRQQLSAAMDSLRTSTRTCLASAHEAREALHTDHAEARQAWRQFNTEMRQLRAGPQPAAEPHQ